jgi:hypothetical protein
MRKMLPFGIAAVLTAVAITAWATGAPPSKAQVEITTAGINPFMLMTHSGDLQVQEFEDQTFVFPKRD